MSNVHAIHFCNLETYYSFGVNLTKFANIQISFHGLKLSNLIFSDSHELCAWSSKIKSYIK